MYFKTFFLILVYNIKVTKYNISFLNNFFLTENTIKYNSFSNHCYNI